MKEEEYPFAFWVPSFRLFIYTVKLLKSPAGPNFQLDDICRLIVKTIQLEGKSVGLYNSGRDSPLRSRVCQPTADFSSACPRIDVTDH